MTFERRLAVTGLILSFGIAALPVAAPAAGGLAYGSVTKFSVAGDDGPPPSPGTFGADYQAAATPADTANAPRMPFGFGKMLAKAQGAMAMFKSGVAEKHYVGTHKERVDNVASQTAEITDCVARTLTHLDLAKRTYSVTSLDQPAAEPVATGNRRDAPGPAPSDDGSKVAMNMTTRALGPMTIEGVSTNGYDTTIRMTITKPTGETQTTNMKMTAYYAPFDEPHFGCRERLSMPGASPSAGASMAAYATMMSALRSTKGGSRFTVTSSGPPLPASRLAMWQDVTMSGAGNSRDRAGRDAGAAFGIIIERGDVHAPISDADPAFGIPAGFTKVDA